jgi:hypothetical protein
MYRVLYGRKRRASGIGHRDSGFGKKEPTADSRQPTVREKQGGKSGGEYSPSPLILSLGGARKKGFGLRESGFRILDGEP